MFGFIRRPTLETLLGQLEHLRDQLVQVSDDRHEEVRDFTQQIEDIRRRKEAAIEERDRAMRVAEKIEKLME